MMSVVADEKVSDVFSVPVLGMRSELDRRRSESRARRRTKGVLSPFLGGSSEQS